MQIGDSSCQTSKEPPQANLPLFRIRIVSKKGCQIHISDWPHDEADVFGICIRPDQLDQMNVGKLFERFHFVLKALNGSFVLLEGTTAGNPFAGEVIPPQTINDVAHRTKATVPKFFLQHEEPLWLGVKVLVATSGLHEVFGILIQYPTLETQEKAPVSGPFDGTWKVVIGVGKVGSQTSALQ